MILQHSLCCSREFCSYYLVDTKTAMPDRNLKLLLKSLHSHLSTPKQILYLRMEYSGEWNRLWAEFEIAWTCFLDGNFILGECVLLVAEGYRSGGFGTDPKPTGKCEADSDGLTAQFLNCVLKILQLLFQSG